MARTKYKPLDVTVGPKSLAIAFQPRQRFPRVSRRPTSSHRAYLRRKIWEYYGGDYFNLDSQIHCYVCKENMTYNEFTLGHEVPLCKGGRNTVYNLKPCCVACNQAMGTQNLREFKAQMESTV